ncbi:MAG TPA: hypothetical protein V6C65_23060 [Allocoleopsis sp.]
MDWGKFNLTLGLQLGEQRPLDEAARNEVLRLLSQDREMEAIKAYRDATNATLKDAVNAVNRLKQVQTR